MRPSPLPGATPPAPSDTDLTGKTFGDFRILRRIGQGGMGQVYLAEQVSLKRQVALKIMRPDLAANAVALKRFQNEAEAIARVTHANIVQVYAFGQADGLHYMALEYVDGRNLREFIAKKGTPDLLLALSILRQVAAGLQRASENGIVHRDIKPENILLTRKGEVKVSDFGLSRCFGTEQQPLNLTQSGVSMGTPLYMSPEQVQGKEVDPRTDIYSLGVTAYHMLAGQPPFLGANGFEVAMQHVQSAPIPLNETRPDLPIELCQAVHKMLAKDPAERYQTARELLRDLTRLREGLSGKTGVNLDQVGVRQSGPVLAPSSSMKLATGAATQSAWAAPRRPRWLAPAIIFSLLAAAALGFWLRVRHDRAVAQGAPDSPSTEVVRRPPQPDSRELALLADLRKPIDPRVPGEARRHLEASIQLGVLYLEQRRLAEADAFFKELRERPNGPPDARLYHAYGRIGHALVLAFQDRAKESNDQLLAELERKRPGDVFLVQSPWVRPILVEALNHNAANLAPEPLPEALERLRRLPGPPGKS